MKGISLLLSMLSKKELEVLGLWICGQTAKETANVLNKSNRTVEFHREKIKCKLGVYCASELRIKMIESSEFNAILNQGMDLLLKNANHIQSASYALTASQNQIYLGQCI